MPAGAPRGYYGRKIPDIPWLPPSPQLPDEWFEWEPLVVLHRAQMILETTGSESDPKVREARDREADRCRKSRLYMLNTYGSIFEARPEEEGIDDGTEDIVGSMIPFIMYPFQIWVGDQYYEARRTRGRMGEILNVKARDMGLSNLYAMLAAGDWLCESNFSARVASRVEDLVDKRGDPDSIFWKIEQFIKSLPQWLMDRLAPGFRWSGVNRHRVDMQFIHPTRPGNTIKGESTQANAGRGGRATIILYDEAAFMPDFGAIWQAGRDSTRHRIAISTVSTSEGLDFYNLHKGRGGYTPPRVIEIHWDEHPLHDQKWRREQEERDTPQAVAQEIDMDYFAGQSEWIYPQSHEISPGSYPFVPGAGHLYVTMDDGYDDDFAMIRLQYIRETGRLRVIAAYQDRHKITDYYGSILKGVPESNFTYSPEARRFMMQQQVLPPATYTIDVHFDNVEQMTGMSPYERFIEKYGITCHMEMNPTKRVHLNRWKALGPLLSIMDFNDTDGAPEVLEALQRYRLKENRAGRDQVGEQKIPIHDKDSHFVTALEWFALAWPSIRYNTDDMSTAHLMPTDHNTHQDRRYGHADSPGVAQSYAPAADCPRGFSPCVWRSARTGSCSACGLRDQQSGVGWAL